MEQTSCDAKKLKASIENDFFSITFMNCLLTQDGVFASTAVRFHRAREGQGAATVSFCLIHTAYPIAHIGVSAEPPFVHPREHSDIDVDVVINLDDPLVVVQSMQPSHVLL